MSSEYDLTRSMQSNVGEDSEHVCFCVQGLSQRLTHLLRLTKCIAGTGHPYRMPFDYHVPVTGSPRSSMGSFNKSLSNCSSACSALERLLN